MGNCPHGSGVECGHWSWTGQSNDPKRHQRAAVYEEAGEQEFADTKRIRSTAKKIFESNEYHETDRGSELKRLRFNKNS